jgi:hypothetical protein
MTDTATVVAFRAKEEPCEKTLNILSARVLDEVFEGDKTAFDEAFADASTQQLFELTEAAMEFAAEKMESNPELDIKEELYDAMIGVMKQWLGEHKADEEDLAREAFPAGF